MYYSHEINSELFDSNAISVITTLQKKCYDIKLCNAKYERHPK